MASQINLYNRDFFAWTQEQIKLLKEKSFSKLDVENLLEEVESMGKREKRELSNRLEILLMHLLKWKYQPEEQSKSWMRTIREQRHQIKKVMNDNPSLVPKIGEYISDSYSYARQNAHYETGVFLSKFPVNCEWVSDQLLSDEFFPN